MRGWLGDITEKYFAAFSEIIEICNINFQHRLLALGSRSGAVVRALASHQCVLGSIPGPGVADSSDVIFNGRCYHW